ncbi:MAG TPA: hypothetical protein PKD63_00905 [Solirubrobacteraceae bacterium]|nr:hypothetical protein [Solirubrobacteraceae bacterium]
MDHGAPSSWLVASPGLEVVSSDGLDVGSLRHVLGVEEEDIFDGIVIEARGGGMRFVDAADVAEFFEGAVVLRLDGAACEHLPAPQPAPGGLKATGDTPPPGPLQRKLHRAWELISGEG